MGEATREFFLSTLADTVAKFEEHRADCLVIGSLASAALLDRSWDTEEDIDVFVRVEDAERLLEVFAAAGYATHRRDEHWVYKVARPNVTVDLIFRAGERIVLDNDHLQHARVGTLGDIEVPIPALEDFVVMKAVFDAPTGRATGTSASRRCRPTNPTGATWSTDPSGTPRPAS